MSDVDDKEIILEPQHSPEDIEAESQLSPRQRFANLSAATMEHFFYNDATMIDGYLELLLKKDGLTSEKKEQYLQGARGGMDKLLRHMQDFRRFVGSGDLDRTISFGHGMEVLDIEGEKLPKDVQ